MGNICNLATAFALGQQLQKSGKSISVVFDAIDTAPSPLPEGKIEIDGVTYQRSLRWSGGDETHLPQFRRILQTLSSLSGVPFTDRKQADILGDSHSLETLRDILAQQEQLGALFSPEHGCIGIRAACPVVSCGLADKAGVRNRYLDDSIHFHCPYHGEFSVSLHDPQQASRLELNTPMRNLFRNRLFGMDRSAHWIQVVGADYAGFYQEQLLWRPISVDPPTKPPLIVYSPAILDWSGTKLSKSLYVAGSAYSYLRGSGLEYMLSYDLLEKSAVTLEHVYHFCHGWMEEPHKLFRCYAIHHLHHLLVAAGRTSGVDGTDRVCGHLTTK
jgi:hypothetical protein